MNKLIHPLKKGFTFIELLIVTAIIVSLSGLSLATYHRFTSEKQLETAAENLVDILELAKKKISSGDLFLSCSDLPGYQVNVTTNSYSLYFCCKSGTTLCPTPTRALIQKYQFPNGITASIISGETNIYFKPLNAGASTSCLSINHSSINQCRFVNVKANGIINQGTCSSCPCTCP